MAYTENLLTRSNLVSRYRNEHTTNIVYLYGSSWIDEWYGSEPPDNALYELDYGSDDYKWESERKSSEETEWLAAHFSTKRRIVKAAFHFSYEPRYATNITLQGSNDSTNGSDGTWVTISSGMNNPPDGGGTSQTWTVEHEFENADWYSWYRITMKNRPDDDPPIYSTSCRGWMLYGIEGEEYFEETPGEGTPIVECIKGDMLRLKLDIYNPMRVAQQVRIDLEKDTPLMWPSMSLVRTLPLKADILTSYPFGGDYPISATLLNYDGTEDPPYLPGIVRVYDIPQIESPRATPTTGYGPTTVTLLWAPYEAGGIREYEFDDGAGNVTVLDGGSTSVTVTYQNPGTYSPRIRARMINGRIATVLSEVSMTNPQYLSPGDGITGNGTHIWLPHAPIKPGTMNMSASNISEWTLDHSKGHLYTSRDLSVFDLVIINSYTYYALSGDPDGWVAFPEITVHAAPGDLQWLYLTPAIGSGTSTIDQTVAWGLIPTAAVADLVTRFEIDWNDGSDIEQVMDNTVTTASHYYAVGDVLRHTVRRDLGFQIVPSIRWVATVDDEEIAGDWFEGTAFYIAPAKPTIYGISSSKTGYTVPRLPLTLGVVIEDPDDVARAVRIDWGDGVSTEGAIPATAPLTVTRSHQYGSVGTYTITISVISDHYLAPDSTISVIVVSDLLTESISKTVDGKTAVLTHSTAEKLDGIGREIEIKWGDE